MEEYKDIPEDIRALFIEEDGKGGFRFTMLGALALISAIIGFIHFHCKVKK